MQAFHEQQQMAANSPADTGQLAAGLAGLLAVPIVAWSEFTLKTTGKTCENQSSIIPPHLGHPYDFTDIQVRRSMRQITEHCYEVWAQD